MGKTTPLGNVEEVKIEADLKLATVSFSVYYGILCDRMS